MNNETNVQPSDWGFGGDRVDRPFMNNETNVQPSGWGFGGVHRAGNHL